MAGTEGVWRDIAARHGLVEPDLDRVASWWHTDGDLGRNIEVLTDMNKSRHGRLHRLPRHPRRASSATPSVPSGADHPLSARGAGALADAACHPVGSVVQGARRARCAP